MTTLYRRQATRWVVEGTISRNGAAVNVSAVQTVVSADLRTSATDTDLIAEWEVTKIDDGTVPLRGKVRLVIEADDNESIDPDSYVFDIRVEGPGVTDSDVYGADYEPLEFVVKPAVTARAA